MNIAKTASAPCPSKPRIVIVIEGGVVQAVLADTAAEITVIDYDVDGCDFRSEETFLIQSSNIHPPDPAWRFVFDAEIDPARIDHIKTARRHPDYIAQD